MRQASFGPFTVKRRWVEAAAMLRFGVQEGNFNDRLSAIFDADWPRVTNSAVDVGDFRILCLSPVEWLFDGIDGATLACRLMPALSDDFYHVTDESGAWTSYRLEGLATRDLLAKGCNIDLDKRAFLPGQCAQTRLAQIYAIIHHDAKGDAFDIYVEAPLDGSFFEWIAHSSIEFQTGSLL